MAKASGNFLTYGGNTSSITVRTPANSLLFLDAGTGIQYATAELDQPAEKIYLGLSHTHADHTQGLGMSGVPFVNFRPWFSGKKVILMGPPGVVQGLRQFYDGSRNWPVKATDDSNDKPNMPAIDFGNALELKDGGEYEIDASTKLKTLRGNHPVDGSSIFFRFESGGRSVIYATDNEFDWKGGLVPNEDAESFKERYMKFIEKADVLLADAQYTREKYIEKKPMDVRGWGHAYIDQIIDLAGRAGVESIMPTHHDTPNTDSLLTEIENAAKDFAKKQGYSAEVVFAREGMVINL